MVTKHEYYQQLAEYWFEERDYETCAYYRIKAKSLLEDAVRQRVRRSQLNNIASKETLVLDNI